MMRIIDRPNLERLRFPFWFPSMKLFLIPAFFFFLPSSDLLCLLASDFCLLPCVQAIKGEPHIFKEKTFKKKRQCSVCRQNVDNVGSFCRGWGRFRLQQCAACVTCSLVCVALEEYWHGLLMFFVRLFLSRYSMQDSHSQEMRSQGKQPAHLSSCLVCYQRKDFHEWQPLVFMYQTHFSMLHLKEPNVFEFMLFY